MLRASGAQEPATRKPSRDRPLGRDKVPAKHVLLGWGGVEWGTPVRYLTALAKHWLLSHLILPPRLHTHPLSHVKQRHEQRTREILDARAAAGAVLKANRVANLAGREGGGDATQVMGGAAAAA